eukprot:1686897-Rhodomonas_salina.2
MRGSRLHLQRSTHSMAIRRPRHTLGPMGADAQTSMAAHGRPRGSNVRPPPRTRRYRQEPARRDTG